MIKSESIAKIAPAFFKAQISFKTALKDSSNPYYKSKYADLASVWGAVKEALEANQLLVTQSTGQHPDGVIVYTYLIHAPSAEFIGSELLMRASKKMDDDTYVPLHDPQAYGSLISYGRRYSLAALLGVITDDDDAESAMGRNKPKAGTPEPKAGSTAADDFFGQSKQSAKETPQGQSPMTMDEAKEKIGEVFEGSQEVKDMSNDPAYKIKNEFDKAKTVAELKTVWRNNKSIIEKLTKADQDKLTVYAANIKAIMTTSKEEKKNA